MSGYMLERGRELGEKDKVQAEAPCGRFESTGDPARQDPVRSGPSTATESAPPPSLAPTPTKAIADTS